MLCARSVRSARAVPMQCARTALGQEAAVSMNALGRQAMPPVRGGGRARSRAPLAVVEEEEEVFA